MNISSRVFAITDNDIVVKIPNSKLDKLLNFKDEVFFPEFKNKKIRIASFIIETKNRKPHSILRSNYYFYDFDDRGRLDWEKHNENLHAQLDESDLLSTDKVFEKNINYASKEHKEKVIAIQYQWSPSEKLFEKIHKQIFK